MWPWRKRSDQDFADEIHAHIANETKRLVDEEGLNFTEAKASALRSFGNVTRAKERFFERHSRLWLEDLRRDALYAVRSLRRSPGFAAVAILTLAVGIGATTAIYSVVDAILLQPLPFPNSDRLVRVVENYTGRDSPRVFQRGVNYQNFLEWRSRTKTLADVIAFSSHPISVTTDNGAARLWGGTTSSETFGLLKARAMLGRTFDVRDQRNPNVIVLGFNAWRRQYQSDPHVVGKTVELGAGPQRRLLTIVGVLPDDFEFPTGSLDFYLPLDPSRPPGGITLIAWLRPGVPLQAAIDEANAIGSAIRPPVPADRPALTVPRFDVSSLKHEVVKDLRPALRLLLAAVALVLMIVCANVANLLLARGTARHREMAVRVAIGAGRGRLVRQILAECFVLAIAGGILGALLGALGVTLVKKLTTIDVPGIFSMVFGSTVLPRGNEVTVDLRMFGIAFAIATITCLVFSVFPMLHVSRMQGGVHIRIRSGNSGTRESRIRAVLVIGQLVMATVLLVGAGLLIRSFVNLSSVEKGYDESNVLAVQLVLPNDYPFSRRAETIDTVLSRLRADRNVRYAGFSRAGVLIGEEIILGRFTSQRDTPVDDQSQRPRVRLRSVTDGFLPAMGIRFLAGRDLAVSHDQIVQPEIELVVNRLVALHLFGKANTVGEVYWQFEKFGVPAQVVGVVEELRNESLEDEPFPEVFVDYRQLRPLLERLGNTPVQQNGTALGVLSFAIRTNGNPESAIPGVVRIVRAVDPNAGVDAIVPIERLVSTSVARPRLYAVILGLFAAVAGFLAVIGIYGVLAYGVTQRTQEIGLRMALGAERHQVLALVLGRGFVLTIIGIAIGLVGAVGASRFLEGMLFGMVPLDLTTFAAVSLLFAFVAMCASYVPARRATTVNPLIALRTE